MANFKVQPWGVAPTPLLPCGILASFPNEPIPSLLREITGEHALISDINSVVWNKVGSINKQQLEQLVEKVKSKIPAISHIETIGLNSIDQTIQDLPFSVRTRNAVARHPEIFEAHQLTYKKMLRASSFGIRSAIEFCCVVEAAKANLGVVDKDDLQLPPSESGSIALDVMPPSIYAAFQRLAAYAAGELAVDTLANALPDAPTSWPNEIKTLWKAIGGLSSEELAGDLKYEYSVPTLISRASTRIDVRMQAIITERLITIGKPTTLETLGQRFEVTRERIRQLEKRAQQHLDIFLEEQNKPIYRRAKLLRENLGSAVPAEHPLIEEALDSSCHDISIQEIEWGKSLILWLAGPYKLSDTWLTTNKNLAELTTSTLIGSRNELGLIDESSIQDSLNLLGIKQEFHNSWISHVGDFLHVRDGIIYFQGTICEKFKALLEYYQRPLTVEEVIDEIGSDSVRSARQRLIEDPGFWRINKQNEFVIAGSPGYDEYTGIIDEIVQELESCGGSAAFDYLVEKVSRVYGVKEISVAAYLNTPMFVKDIEGKIHVRDSKEGVEISTDITKTAACYRSKDGAWMWRVEVSNDLARGSGRMMPNAFAQLLGCELGNKIELATEHEPIRLSWPLTSNTGAAIGSIRHVINGLDAAIGDFIFIKASKPIITFTLLRKSAIEGAFCNAAKVCLLLGSETATDEVQAIANIAMALDIPLSSNDEMRLEARRIFSARGETDLAEMVDRPSLSVDDYINSMGKLFEAK